MKILITSGKDGEPTFIVFRADAPVEAMTAIQSIKSNFLGLTVNGRPFAKRQTTGNEVTFILRD